MYKKKLFSFAIRSQLCRLRPFVATTTIRSAAISVKSESLRGQKCFLLREAIKADISAAISPLIKNVDSIISERALDREGKQIEKDF
jgi:hypothetical protein